MLSRLPLLALGLPLSLRALARKITFPPVAALNPQGFRGQHALGVNDEGVDVSTDSKFAGLMTYANLPYVHCLADNKEGEEVERFDVGILGAGFDTVSTICGFISSGRQ